MNDTANKKLKPFQEAFIQAYIACGYVGQRAYLKLRPHVKPKTAQVESSKLLSLPIIREELERVKERECDRAIASREFLIQEAHEVAKEAREKGAYGATVKAIELKGKLNKLFDRSEPEMEGYVKLVQMLQINVNAPAPVEEDDGEVIDIEAEES